MITAISIIAGVFAALWLYGAIKADIFGGEKHVPASDALLRDVEPFSRRKQFADIGNANVAYIDEGQGQAVLLLHGCPFHAYEWKDIIPLLAKN